MPFEGLCVLLLSEWWLYKCCMVRMRIPIIYISVCVLVRACVRYDQFNILTCTRIKKIILLFVHLVLTRSNNGKHNQETTSGGALINFAKFTGKHLCLSLIFNKVSGLRPETIIKKRLQ